MNKQMTIELLNEMKENCYKETSTDPKRFDKGEALTVAIECIKKCERYEEFCDVDDLEEIEQFLMV